MLAMEDFFMIRDLYRQGLNISQISEKTGFHRNTVRKFLASTAPLTPKKRREKPNKLSPFKEYIKQRITDYPLSAARIFREIKLQGFIGSYSLVKTYIRTIRPSESTQAVIRYETKPGTQAQVDWGECDRIEVDGQVRKLYCFSIILGYSRMRYMEFTLSTDVYTLIQCHMHAFEYFGGITEEILYDNIKQVVIRRAIRHKNHTWNSYFEAFFTHFGYIPRLCRPYRPQTKGKIENVVGFVKRDLLYASSFQSFTHLNEQARIWMDRVNATVHGTTNAIPFERLNHEHLKLLAGIPPFIISITEARKITRDAYLSYLGNRYSVPYTYAGREAKVRVEDGILHIFVGTTEVATHPVLKGSRRTSRSKDHFSGLLGIVMKQNTRQLHKPSRILRFSDPIVEHRSLSFYETFSGGDR